MTRRGVLERYRVGIVNYRIKTLRYSQDQALSDFTQIEQSERLTVEEIYGVLITKLPMVEYLSIPSYKLKKVSQAIYEAQERKAEK